MKEFRPGVRPWRPLDPPMDIILVWNRNIHNVNSLVILLLAFPEFPRRGWEVNTWVLGKKPIIWQDFCRKLHEKERNWTKTLAYPGSANDFSWRPLIRISQAASRMDFVAYVSCIPQRHFWCDTYWPLGDQRSSRVTLPLEMLIHWVPLTTSNLIHKNVLVISGTLYEQWWGWELLILEKKICSL